MEHDDVVMDHDHDGGLTGCEVSSLAHVTVAVVRIMIMRQTTNVTPTRLSPYKLRALNLCRLLRKLFTTAFTPHRPHPPTYTKNVRVSGPRARVTAAKLAA